MRVRHPHLHSSMVRLEIYVTSNGNYNRYKFTFQYGQIRNNIIIAINSSINDIYIPVWLDQKLIMTLTLQDVYCYLHSSMVRLEIRTDLNDIITNTKFTFQYGQIRN